MTTSVQTTHSLEVPGAVLRYDIRESEPAGGPVLVMIGSPMGAAGFGTLATHFADRTVVTYDPRGVERSERTDPDFEVTPDVHAADVRAVIDSGRAPDRVDLFASSGGAVNALALVAAHPDLVTTLVAHEPPLASMVPDAPAALAACRAVQDTYLQRGFGAGMAHFIALVSLPRSGARRLRVAAGTRSGDVRHADRRRRLARRSHAGLEHGDRHPLRARPRRAACRTDPDRRGRRRRVRGELARRGGEAVAAALGTDPVTFPSNHGGFLGGEYGQTGEPDAFAAHLREVLAGPS